MATEYAEKPQEIASENARMVVEKGKNLTGTHIRASPRAIGEKSTDKL
jgi:hypothetical protein